MIDVTAQETGHFRHRDPEEALQRAVLEILGDDRAPRERDAFAARRRLQSQGRIVERMPREGRLERHARGGEEFRPVVATILADDCSNCRSSMTCP